MDPLTHTLFGAALADSGLADRRGLADRGGGTDRRTATLDADDAPVRVPLAAATLIIGANLPDIDAVLYPLGGDLSLLWRRGWTHGILAMVVLPLLLAFGMAWWDRAVRRRRDPDALPTDPLRLLPLAFLGVWSHPTLDWMNTYGVRLLMPFDGGWFYGDTLFIVEPWLWLALGGAIFLRHSKGPRALAGWTVLGALTSFVVLSQSPPGARGLWVLGLVTIVTLRFRGLGTQQRWPARTALTFMGLYIALLMVGDAAIERSVREQVAGAGLTVDDMLVGPSQGNPLRREVLIVTPTRYHFGDHDWRRYPPFRLDSVTQPRLDRAAPGSPVVEAALGAPCVRGMVNWLRHPFVEVDIHDDGSHTVYLLDARYTRVRNPRFGGTHVGVDSALDHDCSRH